MVRGKNGARGFHNGGVSKGKKRMCPFFGLDPFAVLYTEEIKKHMV